jgi:hypothetical protein
LYTKQSLCEHYPELHPYIYRAAGSSLAPLERMKKALLETSQHLKIQKKGDLAMLSIGMLLFSFFYYFLLFFFRLESPWFIRADV